MNKKVAAPAAAGAMLGGTAGYFIGGIVLSAGEGAMWGVGPGGPIGAVAGAIIGGLVFGFAAYYAQ